MNRSDFMVGQTVYLKTISHLRDCWKRERIVEATVIKIGKRYIHVVPGKPSKNVYRGWVYQFDMQNDFKQKTEYSIEYVLFLSEQAIQDYWQAKYLYVEIEKILNRHEHEIGIRSLKEIATTLNIPLEYNKGDQSNA